MHRMALLALFFGLASLLPYVSANFGFTSGNFDYVQLSTSQAISWNGQSGHVELRLMVYPSNQELSYLPIAANLSEYSYTWVPTSLAPGSTWTLEAIDGDGNIATSGNAFTIQGSMALASTTVSTSFMQQNPQSTAQPTTLATAAARTTAQTTTAAQATSTNTQMPPPQKSTPTNIKVAVFLGVLFGVAGIVSLTTFFILRYRQKTGKSLNPFRLKKRSRTSLPLELQSNDSTDTLPKATELQGSRIEGTSETSWGHRMELGMGAASEQNMEGRISMAPGAVETSMGKRFELS